MKQQAKEALTVLRDCLAVACVVTLLTPGCAYLNALGKEVTETAEVLVEGHLEACHRRSQQRTQHVCKRQLTVAQRQ